MEKINHTLFLLLNAPDHPHAWLVAIATFFAEYAIWLVPLAIGFSWLRGGEHTRRVLLEATAAGLAGLFINQLIGLVWQTPRPFAIGIGHTLIPHAADSSFPSDHLTLLWAVAFSLLMHRRPRFAGLTLALLGLPMAWARIYLGVHFPFDMLGAASVALLSAWLAFREVQIYMPTVYKFAVAIHQFLFTKLIRAGWVRK